MRILEIAPPWFAVPPTGYGGIEWVVSQLADGLTDAGHDVTLLASGGSRTRARLQTVFDTPPSAALGSVTHDLLHCMAGYRERHDYDLIHDHSGLVGPAIGAVAEGPPVVQTLHGDWQPEIVALQPLLSPPLWLVAISQDQRSRAPAGLRFAGVVHNGMPVESFPFRGEPRRVDEGYLLFVGRSNPDKSPEMAVEVARRLGRPLKMIVKINEPPEQEHWSEVVEPALHGVDVEVLVNVSNGDKERLMAGAAATLMPIRWDEPFGLVMGESMAAGTPVVVFERGAAPEVVVDGKTGFVVAPDDLDAFCEAVRHIDEIDPAQCRAHVEENLSGAAMTRGYLEVFQRVVEGDA